jgi:hypothetical protein
MPLDPKQMSSLMQTNVQSVIQATTPAQQAQLKAFCDGIAMAVVQSITANALVMGTVQSGAGAGGTVQGTVT